MIHGHPTPELLTDYASGALPDGLSLLVASHLTFCPACRRNVAHAEALGGALMQAAPATPVAPPALDAVLARLGEAGGVAPSRREPDAAAAGPASVLPRPIRDRIGGDEGSIAWKFRMPGLSEYVVEGFEGEAVSLLRARPGAGMFAHTHRGEEATLILSGAMKDGGHVWRKGDVALAGQDDDHRPEIIGEETCICLIVMSGSLRFTGPFSRMLNIFTG